MVLERYMPTLVENSSNLNNDCLWFITDIHLTDKELNTTKAMVKNSDVILDNILTTLKDNENIKVVVLSGDIQHKTPTKRELAINWTLKLMEIKNILGERFNTVKDDIKVYNNNNEELSNFSPLFSIKGNHDFDKNNKFTYFNELEKLGVISNVAKIIWNDTQYNLVDYGKLSTLDDDVYQQESTKKVLLCHDYIIDDKPPHWAKSLVEDGGAYEYSILEDKGYDKVLFGHIHNQSDCVKLPFNTELWQVGCIARTSYTEDNSVDEGFTALIDNNSLELFRLNIQVVSYREYFKTVITDARRERENELSDFSLNLNSSVIEYDSYEDSIDKVEGVDIEIKNKAKELIRMVGY